MALFPGRRLFFRLAAAGALAWLASAGVMAEAQALVPVRGLVRSASGAPIAGALVSSDGGRGTAETGADGRFQIDLTSGPHTLLITRHGYADLPRQIEVGTAPLELDLGLTALARFSEDVTVSAVRAPAEAPIPKSDIARAEVEARNYGQEMPFLLSQVPSVTQYADSGAPSGYSYLYLRGIPQTRMNVTIDGMPINEPEDSAFYFSNFGDLADAVDSIQVQRGVGTSSVGAASFVGSINFASAALTDRPGAVVRMSAGSFGTRRLNAAVNSGRLGHGFRLYGQAAVQDSDGFRHNSGVNQKSLYAGVLREGQSSYLKVFGFFGRAQSSLAYLAADEASLSVDLRTNPLTPEEHDQFGQQFLTAQYHRALSPGVEISAQGFYNGADGWYRIRSASAEPSGLFQYGLAWHNSGASVDVHAASARADFTWGAYFSDFESLHTRDIVSGAADYSNHGFKNEFNTFAKIAWSSGRWRWFGDAQLRWARFRYEGTVPLGSVDWTFFNPKAGARYDAGHGVSLFASLGRGNREPARSDMLQGEDNATVPYRPFRSPARAGAGRRVRSGLGALRIPGRRERVPDGVPTRDRANRGTLGDRPAAQAKRRSQLQARRRGRPDVAPGRIASDPSHVDVQPEPHRDVDAVLRHLRRGRHVDRLDQPRPSRRAAVRDTSHPRHGRGRLHADSRRHARGSLALCRRVASRQHGQSGLRGAVLHVPRPGRVGRPRAGVHVRRRRAPAVAPERRQRPR